MGLPPQPKVRKKRVVKKDPNRVRSLPWAEDELERFRQLLAEEGAGKWKEKAEKLGTGRTAKSLHTRWLRDEGRIIDRPRGAAATQEAALAAAATYGAAAGGTMAFLSMAPPATEEQAKPQVAGLSLQLQPDPFVNDRITPRTAFCANTLFGFNKKP